MAALSALVSIGLELDDPFLVTGSRELQINQQPAQLFDLLDGHLRVFRKGIGDDSSITAGDTLQIFDPVILVGLGLSPNPIGIFISELCFTVRPEKAFSGTF